MIRKTAKSNCSVILKIMTLTLLMACSSLQSVDKSRLNSKEMQKEKSLAKNKAFFFSGHGNVGSTALSGACSVCAQ